MLLKSNAVEIKIFWGAGEGRGYIFYMHCVQYKRKYGFVTLCIPQHHLFQTL